METDGMLASRYLKKQWKSLTKQEFPPMDLQSAVVQTVNAVGYRKSVVDNLIKKYRAKQGERP